MLLGERVGEREESRKEPQWRKGLTGSYPYPSVSSIHIFSLQYPGLATIKPHPLHLHNSKAADLRYLVTAEYS